MILIKFYDLFVKIQFINKCFFELKFSNIKKRGFNIKSLLKDIELNLIIFLKNKKYLIY